MSKDTKKIKKGGFLVLLLLLTMQKLIQSNLLFSNQPLEILPFSNYV